MLSAVSVKPTYVGTDRFRSRNEVNILTSLYTNNTRTQ